MRKALSRDVDKESVIPLDHPVRPEEVEWRKVFSDEIGNFVLSFKLEIEDISGGTVNVNRIENS